MSDFKVKFRGVRGSFPVADKDFLQFGGNTSCVEIKAGEHLIILDAGTGIVKIGDELMEKYISSAINPKERTPIKASILLSHIHQDHLLGLTFFKPMHIKSTHIDIFGGEQNLKKDLSELVFGKTFPIDLDAISCECSIQNLDEEYVIIFKSGKNPEKILAKDANPKEDDIVISFYKSYVHPQDGVMIYKITYKDKSVVYATDKECYLGGDKKFVKFAKDCDLLIHDAQYTSEDYLNSNSPKQGYGHSTFDMAVEAMKQVNAKKLAFFHYDPSYNDEKLNRLKSHYCSENNDIYFAYESLEFDI
ncbi:MBL fold metallo-hydrolase [bacterium]|nr:MBL fold metallo-hydrolase [bacterium]